jgi:hypothetical protein
MPRERAMPVLRVHSGDLGAKEHWLVQHPSHHAEYATVPVAYGDNEAVRLVASSGRRLFKGTRGKIEAHSAR